jgi:hypothetical protein
VFDKIGERALEAQEHMEMKPKLLSDALYFNKFEERNKSEYQVVAPSEDLVPEADGEHV